ncbi:MAG: glutathione S-transferase family protein [gamma proteobacterium symbiont of Bathyaustriella thionipta]|nr:glutathione S-transferase family protein [gamma proteobacterium symbiont of Bathyaustriella thionipta]MCU7951280.1 glutathione S-transferase family protein [gamma proteobacterium symbiont of Bathyaustriella thionipta]MCU7954968.1 glutathione S-transferase family protein [gamma proteobacterium symbiont of Bathyaustriella thionipta]MCU7957813.1 glutathione S-transferase family protein [gamma proteobacterium symbiont of Bathyaustriella thionipta]MCU7969017.1 glutathione S-transferase family pro
MPDLTLIIGNKNYSSWSLRPWFWMKHLGIPFKEKRIPLFTEQTNPRLAQYYSNYKVPVLLDGAFIVWDSMAIFEYLAEKFPEYKGWPESFQDRTMARSMCAEMHSSFTALRDELPMNCRKTFSSVKLSDKASEDIERITALWRYFRQRYKNKGSWLFGNFSIVDAMYAPVVLRFKGYGIALNNIEQEYSDYILSQKAIIEWCETGKKESEIILMDEIDVN